MSTTIQVSSQAKTGVRELTALRTQAAKTADLNHCRCCRCCRCRR